MVFLTQNWENQRNILPTWMSKGKSSPCPFWWWAAWEQLVDTNENSCLPKKWKMPKTHLCISKRRALSHKQGKPTVCVPCLSVEQDSRFPQRKAEVVFQEQALKKSSGKLACVLWDERLGSGREELILLYTATKLPLTASPHHRIHAQLQAPAIGLDSSSIKRKSITLQR